MCRTQISVDYDGQLYDCDFNLAAGIPVVGNQKIFDVTGKPYQVRKIRMDKHCYACTAGSRFQLRRRNELGRLPDKYFWKKSVYYVTLMQYEQ